MNVILNEVITVRLSSILKEKLVYFCEQEEIHLSTGIRQMIQNQLKQEMPELFQKRPSSWTISP